MNRFALLLMLVGSTAQAEEQEVEVVVAARDLRAGDVIESEALATVRVPSSWVTSSTVKPDSVAYVVGQAVRVPVAKGDFVTWSFFETAREPVALPQCLRPLKRAKTASEEIAVLRAAVVKPTAAPKRRPR